MLLKRTTWMKLINTPPHTHNLQKLNQEESEELSRWIRPSETEAAIRKFPLNTSPVLDNLTGGFYQTFWNDIKPLLLRVSQKI